jgi:hypothetical protein
MRLHRCRRVLSLLTVGVLVGATTVTAAGARAAVCRAWKVASTRDLPAGSYFEDASGTSSTDVWAVGVNGQSGLIGHWDGAGWTSADFNSPNTFLYDVAAVSPTDAWAVGYYADPQGRFDIARVLHWDGSGWSVYPSPTGGSYAFLYSVSADSATDVWAVGLWTANNGAVHPLALHFDGTSWTQVPTASPTGGDVFNGVMALAPDDVWAVGYQEPPPFSIQSLIEHWDGKSWSVVPAPALQGDNLLYDVSGTASDDVWAAGALGVTPPLTLHWDGTAWSVVPAAYLPNTSFVLLAVKALGPDDVWAVGDWATLDYSKGGPAAEHWDGTAWTITKLRAPGHGGTFRGIEATASTDVWAVGFFYDNTNVSYPLAEFSRGLCTDP